MPKNMTPIKRAKVLTMLLLGLSIGEIARRSGRAKSSIHTLKENKRRSDSMRACQTTPGRGGRIWPHWGR